MKDTGLGTHSLVCHPKTPALAVERIDVSWTLLPAGLLMLRWRVDGAKKLVAPPFAGKGRSDNLWQHSCFELFLKGAGFAYREFNFSPSQRWAAYAFSAYRVGAGHLAVDTDPTISSEMGERFFTCTAMLPIDVLKDAILAGLSAVIEEEGGHKSYWALAHAAGEPDFHQPESFALVVAGA